MFYLRRVFLDGRESNQVVGESYSYVHKDTAPEEFNSLSKFHFNGDHGENCFAFIANGGFCQPIYLHEKSYIMTESGKTFEMLR